VSRGGALAERALAVLRRNDAGAFFRPGPRLYPFQWNWDSAFAALGLARIDSERGRREVRSLLRGQWGDGMVPHIVFHADDPDYAPGPEVWGSRGCRHAPALPTSGLTQPPVLATAVRALHEASPDRGFLEEVVPALEDWHDWFHQVRSDGSGLVVVLHPWEAADNSPRFDAALAAVAAGGSPPGRTDTTRAAADERPTDADYRRYLAVVERLRQRDYRPDGLTDAPFCYVDLCLNSVLAVAEDDLAALQDELGEDGGRARAAASRLREALAALWLEEEAVYGRPSGTFDDLMPLYAGVPDERRARRLFDEALWATERFGPSAALPRAVTTVSKASAAFEPRRYWRGPVWINVNWLLIRGLERVGLATEADELRAHTLRIVEEAGFSEYYDPATGRPLGSDGFTWSAALTLDLLS
jgi:glycogen debranching enzyme